MFFKFIIVARKVLSQFWFCLNLSLSHSDFCHSMSFVIFRVLSELEFCDNLSFVTN